MSWELDLPAGDGLVTLKVDDAGVAHLAVAAGTDDAMALTVEDLGALHLFCQRAVTLVEQDLSRLGRHNSTLFAVRGVARQLIALLDEGNLDAVRATLEHYALPTGHEQS